jgi:hypothetical protein
LRLEIELYKPELLCFVTWDYAFDFVKEAIGDESDAEWETDNEQWIWWRLPSGRLPAMMLTGHPERKSTTHREAWCKKALELLPE